MANGRIEAASEALNMFRVTPHGQRLEAIAADITLKKKSWDDLDAYLDGKPMSNLEVTVVWCAIANSKAPHADILALLVAKHHIFVGPILQHFGQRGAPTAQAFK